MVLLVLSPSLRPLYSFVQSAAETSVLSPTGAPFVDCSSGV